MDDRLIAIVEAVADAWNKAGVDYAVVHGLERYPSSLGRDIDVLVHRGQIDRAWEIMAKVFSENRWGVLSYWKRWVYWTFAYRQLGEDTVFLEIDLSPGFYWGPLSLVCKPEPVSHIGPFKVDTWASFVKRFLLLVLLRLAQNVSKGDLQSQLFNQMSRPLSSRSSLV